MCDLLSFNVTYTKSLQLVIADGTLCATILNVVRLWQMIFKSEKVMAHETFWVTNDRIVFMLLQYFLDRLAYTVAVLAVYLTLVYRLILVSMRE